MRKQMDLALIPPNNELGNGIILLSNTIKLHPNRNNFFIAHSISEDNQSAFQCMLNGYVGFISDSMSGLQQRNEIYAAKEIAIKLLRNTGTYCAEINFRSDREGLLLCEHFLNNSLVRNDEVTFRQCLKVVSRHQFTQRYPSIIRKIEEVLLSIYHDYLSWYAVNEIMEILKHHVFFPVNTFDTEQLKLLA